MALVSWELTRSGSEKRNKRTHRRRAKSINEDCAFPYSAHSYRQLVSSFESLSPADAALRLDIARVQVEAEQKNKGLGKETDSDDRKTKRRTERVR